MLLFSIYFSFIHVQLVRPPIFVLTILIYKKKLQIKYFTFSVFSEQTNNRKLMREIGLTSRLLHIMQDPRIPQPTIETMASVISLLLEGNPDTQALLK